MDGEFPGNSQRVNAIVAMKKQRYRFLEKLARTLARHGILLHGKRVLTAVSGGPDSMVLLDALVQLRSIVRFDLRACHVNHGLRGEDAGLDEQLVIERAGVLEIPLTVRRFEAEEIQRVREGNLEEEARELRYRLLAHTARELNCDFIATGHTRSDQAETLLHRLVRSCGLAGLASIHPVREWHGETVIRPLIGHSREEVLEYARETQLRYGNDSMNEDTSFTRARIRKRLLPMLKADFNPNIEESLGQLAELALDEERFWDRHLRSVMPRVGAAHPDNPSDRIQLLKLTKAEQRRVLRALLKAHGAEPGMGQIEDALQIMYGDKPQGELHFADGLRLLRRYDDFYITRADPAAGSVPQYSLEIPGVTRSPELGVEIRAEILPANLVALRNEDVHTARFDADTIPSPAVLRTRLDGDVIQPLGMEGAKKVKKILQERKVHLEARDRAPIVCFGNEVAWIVGLCESHRFRVTSKTTRILKMTARPLR